MSTTRSQFLIIATLFQASLAVLAFGLAWLLQINPFDQVQFTLKAFLIGVAGTIPMLIAFVLIYQIPFSPFQDIKRFLHESLGPYLAACRGYDLAWLALVTGVSEELLFRGVLQTWLHQWGVTVSLVVSNLIFGVAHAVTPLYPVIAGLLGVYLGVLYEFEGGENLVIPVVAHSLYDFVAFLIVQQGTRELVEIESSLPSQETP